MFRNNSDEGGEKMEYITAFTVGGLICALVQILLDRTKLMPGRIMVLLVCSGAVLGFCGIYEPFHSCPESIFFLKISKIIFTLSNT